jgi:cation-transporting ATPase 13A2
MLIGPSDWLFSLMQLTDMSVGFKEALVGLAAASFALSWLAETRIFPNFARFLGRASHQLQSTGGRKQRRRYKVLLDDLQM